MELRLSAPIERWDEALPLGNGLLGTLMWGGGGWIRLSLDRGDLWDLRQPPELTAPELTFANLRRLVREGDGPGVVKRFESFYEQCPYPTKLPGGRLELDLGAGFEAVEFTLDLERAVAAAAAPEGRCECFVHAAKPVGWIRLPEGRRDASVAIVPPAYGTPSDNPSEVGSLGYPPPETGGDASMRWVRITDGAQSASLIAVLARGRFRLFTILTGGAGDDLPGQARKLLADALTRGWEAELAEHTTWWRNFQAQSEVRLPDPAIQLQYDLVNYYLAAGSRPGHPPIALQGLWTADDGTLPPWKGDYHNDLNTQLTYWHYLGANRLPEGRAFLDFNLRLLPAYRAFARDFFGVPGAAIPGVMDLAGRIMGGWSQYSYSLTNGVWVCHNFYRHWRYTMDRSFLGGECYPFCAEIAQAVDALLEPGPDGLLQLPLSASPEIHDNRLEAFLTPNSNYDLSLLRWFYAALAEMAGELGLAGAAVDWQSRLDRLPQLAVDDSGLMVNAAEQLTESHRHHSQLMAIYPLGLLHPEHSPAEEKIVADTLRRLDALGTGWWCGYSFSWLACLAARCGNGGKAYQALRHFVDGFISRNGFHLNGDYKDLGLSWFKYRPFTLEGNFAAAEAVHEMLLQTHSGEVRLFPALPAEWKDVSFRSLRGEGGLLVTARLAAGQLAAAEVAATCDCTFRCLGREYRLKAGETVAIV